MFVTRVLLVAGFLFTLAMDADAQYWRHHRRAAHYSRMHHAAMAASPFGVSVSTPYYSYNASPSVVYSGPRHAYYSHHGYFGWPGVSVTVQRPVVQYAESPTIVTGHPTPATVYEAAPAYVPGTTTGPTPATPSTTPISPAPALATSSPEPVVDDAAALVQAVAALHARLDLFNGGGSWQSYLELTDTAAADPAQRDKLLRRLDSIARESQFKAVSQLAEFRQLHALLQAMKTGQAPAADLPPAPVEESETIPAPSPQSAIESRPMDGNGERSVLNGV